MGSNSGEESGSSPSISSSSSSSSGSGREGDKAVRPSADPQEATASAAATTSSAPDGEEDSNAGFADPESPNSKADSSSSSSEGVLVERPVASNQDPRYLQGDPETGILVDFDGSVQEHTEGEEDDERNRRGEDSSREDMFEDAPDQLAYSEGRRSIGLEESMAMIDIGESNREKQLMDEVARMHAQLNGTVAECHRYKEERELMERELATLRLQLQSMTDEQSLIAGASVGEIEHLIQEEKPTALQSVLMDCTKFASHLKTRFDQQLQSEATIGELHSVIYSKDQEIEELNVKLSEFSVSHDVVASYMGSVRDLQLESSHESSDAVVKRLLKPLGGVISPQDCDSVDSSSQDISLVEKKIETLIEKYGKIVHETKQLGQFLTTIRSGFSMPPNDDQLGLVFEEIRNEFQDRQTRELSCLEKVTALEEEKSELLEQLEKVKVSLQESKLEASKAKADHEQAENRLATAKEKLSMAVTKGKSLVQHRDSLKQSLAEKTLELQKCMQELQQKSNALKTVEETLEELTRSRELFKEELQQKSVALQAAEESAEALMKKYELVKQELEQKSVTLEATEENAEELMTNYELVKQELEQKSVALEAAEESAEALMKNYELVKQELEQKSIALETAEGGAQELIKCQELVLSLQNTITERENILLKIEEVISVVDASEELKYTDIIERVHWLVGALSENRKILDILSSFDLPVTISSALLEDKINWLTASHVETNKELTKLQDELGNTHSSLESCQSELAEAREEINKVMEYLSIERQGKESLQELHDDLVSRYQEIERKLSQISLQKNELLTMLEEVTESKLPGETVDDVLSFIDKCKEQIKGRMELKSEPSSLLREAFHKVQTSLFLRTQDSFFYERLLEEDMTAREEVKRLSNKIHRASQEIVAVRNERDSLQKEYERVEERSALLREKLSMAVKKGKGLVQERENLKHSLDEKNSEIEQLKEKLKLQDSSIVECNGKITHLAEELANARKLESVIVTVKEERNQIESSLLESNHTLSKLVQSIELIILPSDSTFESPIEKLHQIARNMHESEAGKMHAEEELQKLKEKATLLANRLEDSNLTIKSLEEALSEAENRISMLLEEKEIAEMSKASVEQELEKVKEETRMQVSKLENASEEVQLLQYSLSEAENKISLLMDEMHESTSRSKLEIDSLNAKLATCMEELAGESNLKSQSADLFNQLRNLESFAKDGNVISLMGEGFEKNIGNLRNVIHSFKDIHERLYSDGLESHYSLKQDDAFSKLLVFPQFEDFVKEGNFTPYISIEDSVDNISSLTKYAEGISSQMRLLLDRVAYFSSYMTGLTTLMLEAVGETKAEVIDLVELKESLQLNVTKLEADYQAQTSLVATIHNYAKVLLSACNDAVETLQIDNDAYGSEEFSLSTPIQDLGDLDEERNNMAVCIKAAQALLYEARKTKAHIEHLCNAKNAGEREIEALINKLEEVERITESASRDKIFNHERANKLEKELDSLKSICNDLEAKIDDYQGIELKWKDKEQELLSLQTQLSKRNRGESWGVIQNQLETLFNEVDRMKIPFKEIHMEGPEMRLSTSMDKIFYVVSNVFTLQHVINKLVVEKESMQSDIAAQADEIRRLKTVAESFTIDYQELKRKESNLNDLAMNMERIIQKAGGIDSLEDPKPADANSFLLVLERLLLASIQESESSKSKAQELGSRLQVSQMVVDELAEKIKVLESTAHSRPPLLESKDRGAFDASSSEISEIEDSGSLGKKPASSAPAAHVRTLRKGSTDHLALDIDMESDRLITSPEADAKGHLFKSLNTSGLIPKQGKVMADRIDSIWVSGGRILMARPRARIGLIAYWLLLHIWVLGSIL